MRVVVALVAAGSLAALQAFEAAPQPPGAPPRPVAAQPAGHPAALPASAPAPAPAAVDINALVHRAQSVHRKDAVAWSRFRFHRTVRSERLDDAGAVLQASVLEFEIMPMTVGGFDERLLRIEGREPTQAEITRYREEASFSRHYATLGAADTDGGEESGYSLATLLRLSAYKYVGVESLDGVAAHRLDFEPDPVPHGSGVAAKVTQAMAGSLWLTVDGAHLVRARAATVRPVSLYLGLGKVHSLEVLLEAAPAGAAAPEVYLPRRLMISTNLRVFFSNQHRRRTFSYADFAPLASPSAAGATRAGGAAP